MDKQEALGRMVQLYDTVLDMADSKDKEKLEKLLKQFENLLKRWDPDSQYRHLIVREAEILVKQMLKKVDPKDYFEQR